MILLGTPSFGNLEIKCSRNGILLGTSTGIPSFRNLFITNLTKIFFVLFYSMKNVAMQCSYTTESECGSSAHTKN